MRPVKRIWPIQHRESKTEGEHYFSFFYIQINKGILKGTPG